MMQLTKKGIFKRKFINSAKMHNFHDFGEICKSSKRQCCLLNQKVSSGFPDRIERYKFFDKKSTMQLH